MRHTLFISDIHLEDKRADISECFLNFLKTEGPKADAVYILGDLFEVWIGDDNNTPFYQTILSAIQTLSTTTPVYFMRGNRDFLIGKLFAQKTGCTLLEDPSLIDLYGQRILLSHGDIFCTMDEKHQKFRAFTQNSQYNRFFLWLPLWLRQRIATLIRGKSQKHMQQMDNDRMMDVTPDAITEIMQTHHAYMLIHGHTHRPNIHHFTIGDQSCVRIVLGDWHRQGSALVYYENGEFLLQSFDFLFK